MFTCQGANEHKHVSKEVSSGRSKISVSRTLFVQQASSNTLPCSDNFAAKKLLEWNDNNSAFFLLWKAA